MAEMEGIQEDVSEEVMPEEVVERQAGEGILGQDRSLSPGQ